MELYVCLSILVNSREGVKIPLGDKFQPWGPEVKLSMALKLDRNEAIGLFSWKNYIKWIFDLFS
jgi:hypothetical protein